MKHDRFFLMPCGKPIRSRKCKVCGASFTPARSIAPTCESFACRLEYANKAAQKSKERREKAERDADRARRESLKTRREWMAEAQSAVNAYCRERDYGLPCISCGRHHQGAWHAGHFLSRGAHPELALDPRNIHRQCAPCNTHLSGNQLEYRKGLLARYGLSEVEWLEGHHEPKKYTIDELRSIRDEYRKKLKELLEKKRYG